MVLPAIGRTTHNSNLEVRMRYLLTVATAARRWHPRQFALRLFTGPLASCDYRVAEQPA